MNVSKNRILIWSVILLVIANVAVLVTIWLTDRQRPHRGTPADYLVKELGLNKEQVEKLRSLAKEHRQQSMTIREQIKEGRHNLFQQLKQSTVNDSAKLAAADNVAKHLKELDLLTFDHFMQVRAICTPGQQKKFDGIIEEVLQMIASRPPPRKGPGGEEHMPPPGDRPPPPEH